MPRFRVKIEALSINGRKFTQTLQKRLETQAKLAVKEFAKTAINRIPIRTGFAAGAMGNLTKLVGGGGNITPAALFKRRGFKRGRGVGERIRRFSRGETFKEYYYPPAGGKVLKTPFAGRRFATPVSRILRIRDGVLSFNYNINISYFNLQDVTKGPSPRSPWRAFELGRQAFIDYMISKAPAKLPTPFDDEFRIVTTLRR